MKKFRRLIYIGLSVFLVMLSLSIYIRKGQNNQQSVQMTAQVKRQSFQVDLNVIGVLDAAKSHMITSELQGNEGKIIYLIDDGAKVVKGDLLVQLDPAPFQKQVEQLKAEVAGYEAAVQAAEQAVAFEKNQVEREIANAEYLRNVAELELKKLQEGDGPLQLSQFQEEQHKAQLELQRYEQYFNDLQALQKQGYTNNSENDATKEKVSVLKKQLEAASNRYDNYKKNVLPAQLESGKAKKANAALEVEQTKQGGIYKIAKAQANLNQIKSKLISQKESLSTAERELGKTEIKAPFDGIVILFEAFREREKRKPRVGDTVFMNQPILYLPDISKMIVKTRVREIDLFKLSLGQKGKVTVDAYPDTVFEGELNFIGALATSENAQTEQEKYFQVSFMLNGGDKRLRPGMTCRAQIISKSLENVLTVPVQAVFYVNTLPHCYIQGLGGRFSLRPVTIGGQNEDFVEISKGLDEGDVVSLVQPAE